MLLSKVICCGVNKLNPYTLLSAGSPMIDCTTIPDGFNLIYSHHVFEPPSCSSLFPATGFTTIPASERLEEENWLWYTPQSFYPVRIGDVYHSKYQVFYKLGYGTTSTIWICLDLQSAPLFFVLKQAKHFQSW